MQQEPLGALALAAAIRDGEIDPVEHTEAVLDQARTLGATVGAFAHILTELSLEQAECARTHHARRGASTADAVGDARASGGSLLGVPVPIKDLSRIAGQPWSAGSAIMQGTIADVTDGPVQRLLDAGTVTIGKTSTPEFGMPCYTEPAVGAAARTPWDLRRTAGGSSGGAAAAVATGIVPLAHGSDGGGSIRIPAACCGVLGLKPSRGAVSPGPYSSEGPGLVTDGMLARSVADLAAGSDVLFGARPGDAFPAPAGGSLSDAVTRPPGSLRIGVLVEPLAIDTEVHPAALRAVDRAVEVIAALGHEIVPVPRPFTPDQWQTFMPLWTVGAAAIDLPPGSDDQLMPLTRWLRDQGRACTGIEVVQAIARLQALARQVAAGFDGLDLVLTPALAAPPAFPEDIQLADPAADFDAQCAFTPWTSTWNMTGRAAMSVPLHREQVDGIELPFGVQLGAVRAGDDALLLQVAAQLERVDPWPLVRRPVL